MSTEQKAGQAGIQKYWYAETGWRALAVSGQPVWYEIQHSMSVHLIWDGGSRLLQETNLIIWLEFLYHDDTNIKYVYTSYENIVRIYYSLSNTYQ